MSRPFGENEAVGRRIRHLSACCRDSERFSERRHPGRTTANAQKVAGMAYRATSHPT
jgi:hypothetical protein